MKHTLDGATAANSAKHTNLKISEVRSSWWRDLEVHVLPSYLMSSSMANEFWQRDSICDRGQ